MRIDLCLDPFGSPHPRLGPNGLHPIGEARDEGKFRQHLTVAERIAMKLGPTPNASRATLTLDPQERRFVWLPLTIFLLLLIGAGLLIYTFVFNPNEDNAVSATNEASSPVAIADNSRKRNQRRP